MPWCDPCSLPLGHGQCPACLALRYPGDGPDGIDYKRLAVCELDVNRMPPPLRRAARRLLELWREDCA